MSYKVDRDLHRMLRHQDLIESSLSFVSGSEDFIRENDIFPSSQSGEGVMRGLRYPNGTGVVAPRQLTEYVSTNKQNEH